MSYKQLFTLLFFSVTLFTLKAQTTSWEVGWQLFQSAPLPTGIAAHNKSGPSFLNGLLVKHEETDFKERLSIQYLNLTTNTNTSECCFSGFSNSYEGLEMLIGVEKSARSGSLEYFAIFDLGLSIGQYRSGQIDNFGFNASRSIFSLRYRAVGAYPGMGANLWLWERIALNAEVRWPGVFYRTTGGRDFGFGVNETPSSGVVWQKLPESSIAVLIKL